MFLPDYLFAAGSAHWSLFTLLGLHDDVAHVAMAALATIFILYLSVRMYRAYESTQGNLVPSANFDLKNVFEIVCEQLYKLFQPILGENTTKYFPFLATIFLFIVINNLMGLIPGLLAATYHPSTNYPVGIMVFLYYNYEGWREHGKDYAKHFLGPVMWLAPLMVVIELVSHCIRPVSLSLRLLGNISGDHLVMGIFSNMVPVFVPIAFMALGLFVCFVQAFVFTMLSTVYIGLATAHDNH